LKNKVINIAFNEAEEIATEYFIKICGFHREGEKYAKMRAEGMQTKEGAERNISVRAVVSSYGGDVISGDTAVIDGAVFTCNAFSQINKNGIKRLYAYLLTAGVYTLPENAPIMQQLYADIWGTSFVDAGLDVLKKRLAGDSALEAFGPGFYGMDIDQLGKFFEILDGGKIGMEVRESCLLLPLKSCAGFLIAVNDKSDLPDADCMNCRAGRKGCEFCHAVIRKAF